MPRSELPVEVEIFDRIADSIGKGAKIGSNSGTSAIPMVLTVPSDSTT